MKNEKKSKSLLTVLIAVAAVVLVFLLVLLFGRCSNMKKEKDAMKALGIQETDIYGNVVTTASPIEILEAQEKAYRAERAKLKPTKPFHFAYEKIIKEVKLEKETSPDDKSYVYYIYDLDNDGVKELIINRSCDESIRNYEFYTCKDDKAVYLGKIDVEQGYIFSRRKGGVYIVSTPKGTKGLNVCETYEIIDGKITYVEKFEIKNCKVQSEIPYLYQELLDTLNALKEYGESINESIDAQEELTTSVKKSFHSTETGKNTHALFAYMIYEKCNDLAYLYSEQ